jgi:hypothetical protein
MARPWHSGRNVIVVDGLAKENQNESMQWIDFQVIKP